MSKPSVVDVRCAECGRALGTNDPALLVQCPVYDFAGELEYIELAHRTCLPEWAVNDRHFEEEAP